MLYKGLKQDFTWARQMKPIAFAVYFLLIWLTSVSLYGQGVRVGPDGEVSQQTLRLPYAFYNENFGFAAGYVYGVVGQPQKQSTLLATVMAGNKGSTMGFLVGRDIQMPRVERLFSRFENFTLYLINFDFYISSTGSIVHLHFMWWISNFRFNNNANTQINTCALTLTCNQCRIGLISQHKFED